MINTPMTARYRVYRENAERMELLGWNAFLDGDDALAHAIWRAEAECRSDMVRLIKLMDFYELESVSNG